MKLTSVVIPSSASASSAPVALQVTAPVPVDGAPGRFVYQRQIDLRFRLGAGDKPVFDPSTTHFGLQFRRLEYDALHPPEGLPTGSAGSLASKVLLTLDAPREIKSITTSSGLAAPQAAAVLGLYRVDRDNPSDKPATTSSAGPGVRNVPAGFVDQRFCVAAEGVGGLGATGIAAVRVIGYPTSPRVALMIPDLDPEGRKPFWLKAGRFDAPGGPGVLTADIGADLAKALIDAAAKIPAAKSGGFGPDGATLTVSLVVYSDEPCALTVNPIEIAFALTPQDPPADEAPAKIVLRFPGGVSTTRTVPLLIPPGVTLTAARLEGVESFASAARPADGVELESAAHAAGVRLDNNTRAAQSLVLPAPIEVAGVAVPALALSGSPTLTLQIQQDHRGSPAGRALATASASIPTGDGPRWVSLLLPESLLLDTAPRWLVISVADGECLWLADEAEANAPPLLISSSVAAWSRAPGLAGGRRILSGSFAPDEVPPALSVRVADFAVPLPPPDAKPRVYDATAAVGSFRAAHPASGVEVSFASGLAGLVSISRVDLRYDRT